MPAVEAPVASAGAERASGADEIRCGGRDRAEIDPPQRARQRRDQSRRAAGRHPGGEGVAVQVRGQRPAVLHGRVEQTAIQTGARRHLGQERVGKRPHPGGVRVGRRDHQDAGTGGTGRRGDLRQRGLRSRRCLESFEARLDRVVSEIRRERGEPHRPRPERRTDRGAQRQPRGPPIAQRRHPAQRREVARAEGAAPRLLQIEHVGAGVDRRLRLGFAPDARQETDPSGCRRTRGGD